MSGHNRWSKIKRHKAVVGAAKGKLFTKIIKEVTVSARLGGGDVSGNARLRVAVLAAREANMPNDTVARAIKKGTGELEGANYEEVTYEGYGPGGVALLVECLTDNRNRTAGDMRSLLTKGGGNLAAEGAVAWVFERRGMIQVKAGPSEEQVLEKALDAGADDVIDAGEDGFEVRTEPARLHAVAQALEATGLKLANQRLGYIPQNTVKVEGETAHKLLKLVDSLEDNDDVQAVHGNFEIDEAVLAQVGG